MLPKPDCLVNEPLDALDILHVLALDGSDKWSLVVPKPPAPEPSFFAILTLPGLSILALLALLTLLVTSHHSTYDQIGSLRRVERNPRGVVIARAFGTGGGTGLDGMAPASMLSSDPSPLARFVDPPGQTGLRSRDPRP
jgi:hypothetical protein